ncbi:MAG: hypothetical protein IT239_01330 [Bacteroidia bacterium]|nr:hypothetical protein [Bacteroidia bacterium]
MKKIFFILIALNAVCFFGYAQTESNQAEGLYYTREKSYGIVANTAGWGVNYRQITNKGAFKKIYYAGEITSLRNPKEVKVKNAAYSNSKGFVYGKLYNVWVVRPEFGMQKILYGKEIKSALQISRIFSVGPSLFFAKPMYIEIISTAKDLSNTVTTERYDPQKHAISQIYGHSSFATGLDKSVILPGLFLKWAYQFDFTPDDERLKSIEVGTTLDLQPIGLQQMAFNKKQYVFLNFYLGFSFGKKFFK